jgi:hypothetical protein
VAVGDLVDVVSIFVGKGGELQMIEEDVIGQD